jgi:acetyl-CoA carboxylase biotin carboxyl carrier protein
LDLKQIKQIIELMKRSELSEFDVEEEGFKLRIKRGNGDLPVVSHGRTTSFPHAESGVQSAPPEPPAASTAPTHSATPAEEAGVGYVKSPMVGTFYRAANPESKPFVDRDSTVVENTVVCIIEAMKIMNEIQAETNGTIIEALVENGQPVEYGQRLFKTRLG